jgi:hypothetical protein
VGIPKKAVVLKAFLILSIVLSACGEITFTPDIPPLILGNIETPSVFQTPEGLATQPPSIPMDNITSEDAIELCGESEYFGDQDMGVCLGPGGESYYVWIVSDKVMKVTRDNPFLSEFRSAVIERKSEISKRDATIGSLWKVILLPFEILGLTSCGVALTPGPQQLPAIPICLGDLTAIGFTADAIVRDGESLANAIINVNQRSKDAAYNFCLMEGKTYAECEKIRNH